ncbi:MAG TPA: hypothetical protein ENN29_12490 [Candidatus Hydrogenedentes bacterium]|nr:hypothetical protein [Candidatus Hydrogenedentota bacterium]
MARVVLDISDPGLKLTVELMLQAEGHEVVMKGGEVTIADSPEAALAAADDSQALVLTPPSGVPDAISAMHQGVYGYILLPLQPGEAPLMTSRAMREKEQDHKTPDKLIPLAEIEKNHIESVLRACKGNQVKAAQTLGIGRNTLWRKIKSWNSPASDE